MLIWGLSTPGLTSSLRSSASARARRPDRHEFATMNHNGYADTCFYYVRFAPRLLVAPVLTPPLAPQNWFLLVVGNVVGLGTPLTDVTASKKSSEIFELLIACWSLGIGAGQGRCSNTPAGHF